MADVGLRRKKRDRISSSTSTKQRERVSSRFFESRTYFVAHISLELTVAKASLDFVILLLQFPKYWDYRHVCHNIFPFPFCETESLCRVQGGFMILLQPLKPWNYMCVPLCTPVPM